jgi:hypothetical protein
MPAKQKGRSTLAGSALILSDNEQFDDVDTTRIHFSGRTGIWTLSAGVSRGGSAVLHVIDRSDQEATPVIGLTTGRSLLSLTPAGCTTGGAIDSASAGSGFSGTAPTSLGRRCSGFTF